MNAATSSAPTRSDRRLARWILLILLLIITPIALLGVGVASLFRLNPEAALIKREVMAASQCDWNTTVQFSAGWCTLTAARTVLRFVSEPQADDARQALAAIRRASVGVYQRVGAAGDWSREQLVTRTDAKMARRGWSRLAGVFERDEAALVYVSDEAGASGPIDLCLAVIDGEEMIVVSTRVDAATLADFARRHLPADGLRGRLAQAGMNL